MNITNLEVELRKIQALVSRWAEQGYVPQIEKNIALQRVQRFYELFLDVETQPQLASSHNEPHAVTPEPMPEVESGEVPEPRRDRGDHDVVEYVEIKHTQQVPQAAEEPVFRIFGTEISSDTKDRFTRDLFCNDPLVFHREIHKLERMNTLDDILIYMSERYTWAESNPSAEEFTDIVLNKF